MLVMNMQFKDAMKSLIRYMPKNIINLNVLMKITMYALTINESIFKKFSDHRRQGLSYFQKVKNRSEKKLWLICALC